MLLAFALPAAVGPAPVVADGHRFSMGVVSHGFAGVRVGYEYELERPLRFGVFWRGSALMMVQGDFDAGEAGFSAGYDLGVSERWFVDGTFAAGYRYQSQSLGRARSLFTQLGACVGAHRGRVSAAVETMWAQTWILDMTYSDFVIDTFTGADDQGAAGPKGSRVYLPAARIKLGTAVKLSIIPALAVSLNGGVLWTPNPFVAGFEGMMFGFFPFYAGAGLLVRVGN
jgi:hypothetical protein